jgi:hypothetical protein
MGLGAPDATDLVSIAPRTPNPYDDDHSPFVVSKSATSCDPNLLGFVLDPAMGAEGKKVNEHYLPLAIYGYFPARVTMEGGPIRRGDAITSSSTPGAGMKATGACRTIGYALDDANEDGTIQVFANTGESTMGEVNALRGRIEALEAQLQQAIGRQGVAYRVEDSNAAPTGQPHDLDTVKQENSALRAQVDALREQNVTLEARLSALEQGEAAPARMSALLSTNAGWPLLALVAVAGVGIVVRRRLAVR